MIKTTEQTKALNKALLTAQTSIQAVEKDSTNPHFRAKYASLTAVLTAVKEPLNAAGLLINQSVAESGEGGNGLIVTTRITHAESSEWIETSVPIPLEQPTAQKVGSAASYGRRYGLTSLLSLSEADDDGAGASKEPARTNGAARKPEPPKGKTATDLLAEIGACETAGDLELWNTTAGTHVSALAPEDKQRVQSAWLERDNQLAGA